MQMSVNMWYTTNVHCITTNHYNCAIHDSMNGFLVHDVLAICYTHVHVHEPVVSIPHLNLHHDITLHSPLPWAYILPLMLP